MVFLGCSISFSSALFRGAAVKLFVCWSVLVPWRAACIAAGCGFLPLHPVASKVRILLLVCLMSFCWLSGVFGCLMMYLVFLASF